MSQYSLDDINEFQMRDKRIMFQSVFSSLCTLYGSTPSEPLDVDSLTKRAYEIIEELIIKFPMKEIPEAIQNQAKGLPF